MGIQFSGVVFAINFIRYKLGSFIAGIVLGTIGNILLLIAITNSEIGLYDHRQSDTREKRKLLRKNTPKYGKESESLALLKEEIV